MSDLGSSMNVKGVIGSHASVTESDVESQVIDPEAAFENDVDDTESIDNKFKEHKKVTVYFTLPSGEEEMILDYDMLFSDK